MEGENLLKTGVIIQTRMGSTRLPGKVMLDLYGKPVICHVIERIKQSKEIDDIILATTTLAQDDVIEEQAEKNHIKCFRGSVDDVLSRYYYCAVEYKLKTVVRITSDCPLIDPFVTDSIIKCFKNNQYDIATNASPDLKNRTYPRGLDTEVLSFDLLKNAFDNAREKYQREHVTPYIYEKAENIYYYKDSKDFSNYRWTLDTYEDFELIKTIYKNLYRSKHDFYYKDILTLIEKYPYISKINESVQQKKLGM